MMKKLVGVLAAVMMMSVPTMGIAAMAGANTVNSAAIVDGAVATVDLANKAVTGAKIADATITATQLANGAVTSAKLAPSSIANSNLTDGSVSTSKIANGAVTSAKIAVSAVTSDSIQDGAVTDAKILSVSASKISGVIGVDKLEMYTGMLIVHKGTADGIITFNSINQAAAVAPDNYLIKVMPGNYTEDINFQNRTNVIIEGSGSGTTTITGNINGAYGTAYHITLKDIAVTGSVFNYAGMSLVNANTSSISTPSALSMTNSGVNGSVYAGMGVFLNNATINQGCITAGYGYFTNVSVTPNSSCTSAITISNMTTNVIPFTNVQVNSAVATGLQIYGSARIKVVNSQFIGSQYGVNLGGGSQSFEMTGSTISGGTNSIAGTAGTIIAANSQVAGPIAPESIGTARIVYCYDGNYMPLANQ